VIVAAHGAKAPRESCAPRLLTKTLMYCEMSPLDGETRRPLSFFAGGAFMSRHDPALAREAENRAPAPAPDQAAAAPVRPVVACGDLCDDLRCPIWRLCRGWGG